MRRTCPTPTATAVRQAGTRGAAGYSSAAITSASAMPPSRPPVYWTTTSRRGSTPPRSSTIVLQGQHRAFDGVAVLGFSATHTVVPSRPGARHPVAMGPARLGSARAAAAERCRARRHRKRRRDGRGRASVHLGVSLGRRARRGRHACHCCGKWRTRRFTAVVALDVHAGVRVVMVAPGTVATEAAAIDVPILVAVGERDVVPNPWLEPFARKSATDITVLVCPRMAHMHNAHAPRLRGTHPPVECGCGAVASPRPRSLDHSRGAKELAPDRCRTAASRSRSIAARTCSAHPARSNAFAAARNGPRSRQPLAAPARRRVAGRGRAAAHITLDQRRGGSRARRCGPLASG
jgi:hypothetical protein